MRTVIMGNSGSGKSTLAGRLAASAGCESLSLDAVYWIDQACFTKRGPVAAKEMTAGFASRDRWVIEGVYGWLIDVSVPCATRLIWLDLPWADCRSGLMARGPNVGEPEFQDLLAWAQAYWTRTSPSSYGGHSAVFDTFPGETIKLTSRAAVAAFTDERQHD